MKQISYQINTRQRSIIHAILESENHVTLREISALTQMSIRTIRYNMETVINWFRNEGVHVDSRPGYGFDFDMNRAKKQALIGKLASELDQPISLTKNQRLRMAIFELLIADHPVSFQYLAVNAGISRSTVVTDMNSIQKALDKYELLLVKTPNRGTRIEGSEFKRRCAVVDIIREEIGLVKYYSLWVHPDMHLVLDRSLPNTIEDFLKQLKLESCRRYINIIEKSMGQQLALFSRVQVMLYLAIMIELQSAKNGQLHFEKEHYDVDPSVELDIAASILKLIKEEHGVNVNDSEIRYVALILLFAKWDDEIEMMDARKGAERSFNISQEAIYCADMLTAACANQLHPLLQTDEELVMNLARHFHTVFSQIKYNYPIINEDLPKILEEYPEIFRSVNSEISIIEDQINHRIPPEEIGYISMYMVAALNKLQTKRNFKIHVVILGDGIRTKSVFLKDRLQLIFPSIEVVALVNGYPEDESILDEGDLIISLIPGVFVKKPVIEVSLFLNENEIRTIQNWIIDFEEKNHGKLLAPAKKPDLVDLLLPEHILLNVSANDWKEVIYLASKPLEEQKLIKPEFCDAIIKITKEYGPYTELAPGVVLLNARPNDGVNKVCMSMLILKEPVDFGDALNINIAFLLGASDNHSHLNALFQLSKVCEQPEFIELLKKATKPSEVLRAIWIFAVDYNLAELM